MATAMVTLTWCDWHLTEKDEEVPATAMPVFEGMALDLCEDCAAQVTAMRLFYELYGSKGPRTMRVPRSKLQKAAAAAQADGPATTLVLTPSGKRRPGQGSHVCPSCSHAYVSRGSLSAHVRQQHGTSLPELEGKPASEKCPACGQGFTSKQALLMHQRKHAKRKPARKSA